MILPAAFFEEVGLDPVYQHVQFVAILFRPAQVEFTYRFNERRLVLGAFQDLDQGRWEDIAIGAAAQIRLEQFSILSTRVAITVQIGEAYARQTNRYEE